VVFIDYSGVLNGVVCRLCGDGSGHSNYKYKIFSLKMSIYLLYKIGYLFLPDMAILKRTASHSCMGLSSWTLHVYCCGGKTQCGYAALGIKLMKLVILYKVLK
jgi:hypothetical protein